MLLRDHYEGTPFDMTRGIAAGPFGDPSRFDWADTHLAYASTAHPKDAITQQEADSGGFERAISIFRCAYSFVSQTGPHKGHC